MPDAEPRSVLGHLHTVFEVGTLGGLTDGQLLARFATRHDRACEAAFALLVERHGAMVLRVCRTILDDPHAAEDAFQATFLVLAEKAGSLRARDTLGPWLYQVAYRVASCARSAAARRRRHELRAAERRVVSTCENTPEDVASVVHAEVNSLPERYRSAVVLCCLQGRSHAEAARVLGCPVGTVQSRLARGRERLRDRLARRGIAPSVVLTAASTTEAALPGPLVRATARLGWLLVTGRIGRPGAMSAGVALLWKGLMGDMLMSKLTTSLAAAFATFALTAAAFAFRPDGVAEPVAPKVEAESPEAAVRVARRESAPVLTPRRLDTGPLRVGATAEFGADLLFDTADEGVELAVNVTPPPFLKIRDLRIRTRNWGEDKRRLVELKVAVDTSRPGDFSGRVRVAYGEQGVDLPVSARVLPGEAGMTKVLVVTPGFGGAAGDPEYYRPWFDLVESANLDVSYLDPSIEGLPGDGPNFDPNGVPEWLKRYDVILLADGGPVFITREADAGHLQNYVRRGGRLVVGASSFMTGSVGNANAILRPFGLKMTDEDISTGPPASDGTGLAPFPVAARPGDEDPFLEGVGSVVFRRGTPVRVTNERRAGILLGDPGDESKGFAAVSRDGGEVVVLGPSLLLQWLGEKGDGADNAVFLRNILTKP